MGVRADLAAAVELLPGGVLVREGLGGGGELDLEPLRLHAHHPAAPPPPPRASSQSGASGLTKREGFLTEQKGPAARMHAAWACCSTTRRKLPHDSQQTLPDADSPVAHAGSRPSTRSASEGGQVSRQPLSDAT